MLMIREITTMMVKMFKSLFLFLLVMNFIILSLDVQTKEKTRI
jgi:hypothetical protein